MTKRTKKRKTPPPIVVIIALIIAVVTAIQQNRQQTSTTPVATGGVTQIATVKSKTQVPAATVSSGTDVPLSTRKPLATDIPGLEITPVSGTLYEVTGTVNALGCPDSRCKVIDTYSGRSIIVVTGTVMGTTYKTKKTRIWYEVISHNGSKVYIHGAFVASHNIGLTE